jgi:FlaA1/EpsC-like NDP-sugar epimerase
VLVTGAGGSIGSELCRQIFGLPVAKLVLFDHDENSIFEIHAELASRVNGPRLVPAVGDIRDRDRLDRLFAEHRPHIVLHAAAYKHVPVMEENTCEAVLNNVFGTREVLDAALEFEAERFLMISTDKAVRPTSIMGATKRAAELLVQNRASQLGNAVNTRCACVRFGNVVGSRGSVVPIFLRQIAAGGPVTITHEEMTRYFMTIPEAVQLVIQAATLGSRGDVYMLDMGNPVKIMDLARRIIEMSGLRPDKDIEIRVVGARPGEKIHEQLWYDESRVRATDFPRVFSVRASNVPDDFENGLLTLEEAAHSCEDRLVRQHLQQLPIDFAPMRLAPPVHLHPAQAQAAHV